MEEHFGSMQADPTAASSSLDMSALCNTDTRNNDGTTEIHPVLPHAGQFSRFSLPSHTQKSLCCDDDHGLRHFLLSTINLAFFLACSQTKVYSKKKGICIKLEPFTKAATYRDYIIQPE